MTTNEKLETTQVSCSTEPHSPRSSMTSGGFTASMADFQAALRKWRVSAWLGWQDAILPFRRTFVGPFWVSIQTGLWVLIIVAFLGPWLGKDTERYTLYVAVGTVAYQFMTTLFVDGAASFTRNSGLIKNIPNPLGIYLLRVLFKACILLFAQTPVILVAAILTSSGIPLMAFASLFGVVLTAWALMGVYLVLATITPRFRDVPHALNAIMRVMMFVTPIFWIVDTRGGVRGLAANFNPLAHMLNVIREPFLGNPPPMISVIVCIGVGAVSWSVGLILFTRNRSLIAAQL